MSPLARRFLAFALVAIPTLLAIPGAVAAPPGWSADRRLTSTAGASRLSYNFARCLAAGEASDVHLVWFEESGGASRVHYLRSPDGGSTWEPARRLSRSATATYPAIALAGNRVYAVWHELRGGRPVVLLRRSGDGGTTWEPEVALTPSGRSGALASIAASGESVRVVWGGDDEGQAEVYTRGSEDGGRTWSPALRLSPLPFESWVATVELSGPVAFVAWSDYRDGNEEEYRRISRDGGLSWGPPIRVTADGADSRAGSVAFHGSDVHHVWFDRRDAGVSDRDVEAALDAAGAFIGLDLPPPPPRDRRIYYLPPFMARLMAKRTAIQAAAPAWVAAGGDPAALESRLRGFEDLLRRWSNGWEIYARRSSDLGATFGRTVRLTRAEGISLRPSVTTIGDEVWIVWSDGRDGEQQVYAKRSQDRGVTWGADRRLTFGHGNPLDDSMHPTAAAAAGFLYVAWSDARSGNLEIYFKRLRIPSQP